jgi:inosine-uridine nucleoside N-ribohydrolase
MTLVFVIPAMPINNVVAANTPVNIVLDADIGVDDAAAVAYLLSSRQANIIGITTVAGNTTVENSANNALLLLEVAGRTNIPVVIGASAPLVLQPSLQGMFVHGPDGLWFAGMSSPHDLSGLRTDAPEFLRDSAVAHPGATLLALGPLTNIARAIQLYPGEMALYSRIIWSGGARVVQGDGNTPVSVFNSWYDPDAAQIVLNSGLPVVMVTADAGRTVTITEQQVKRLGKNGTALGKFLAPILTAYATAVNQSAEPSANSQFMAAAENRNHRQKNQYTIPLYDPTAAVLALKPEWGTEQSALVYVQTPDGVTRGQTVMGLTIPERMSMIADDAELSYIAVQAFSDPNFDMNAAMGEILSRQPDNASVVLEVNSTSIVRALMNSLVR